MWLEDCFSSRVSHIRVKASLKVAIIFETVFKRHPIRYGFDERHVFFSSFPRSYRTRCCARPLVRFLWFFCCGIRYGDRPENKKTSLQQKHKSAIKSRLEAIDLRPVVLPGSTNFNCAGFLLRHPDYVGAFGWVDSRTELPHQPTSNPSSFSGRHYASARPDFILPS